MSRAPLFDGCPSAHALDLIGDRWALLVVRELLLGPKRFTDLRQGLPKISNNVLSQRLDDLEAAGVLERRTLPPPTAAAVYELTPRGLELESVLEAIGRWGAGSALLPDSESVGVDTFVLGLRNRFRPDVADVPDARYEVRFDAEAFEFEVADGRLAVRRGVAENPATTFAADPEAMAAVARGELPVASALTVAAGESTGQPEAFSSLFGEANA